MPVDQSPGRATGRAPSGTGSWLGRCRPGARTRVSACLPTIRVSAPTTSPPSCAGWTAAPPKGTAPGLPRAAAGRGGLGPRDAGPGPGHGCTVRHPRRAALGDQRLSARDALCGNWSIEAAEVRPGALVTHHANLLVKDAGGSHASPAIRRDRREAISAGRGQAAPERDDAEPRHALQPARRGRAPIRARGSGSYSRQGPSPDRDHRAESGTNAIDIPPGAANYERSRLGRSCSTKTVTS